MKFVFDLDGTLCFDRRTIDDEIMQVLLSASKYGHDLVFATTRSYRDCLATLGQSSVKKWWSASMAVWFMKMVS